MESPCPHFTDDKRDAKDLQGACQRVNGNIPGLLPCSVLVWKEILAETGLRHFPSGCVHNRSCILEATTDQGGPPEWELWPGLSHQTLSGSLMCVRAWAPHPGREWSWWAQYFALAGPLFPD